MKRHTYLLILLLIIGHSIDIQAQFPLSDHISSYNVSSFAEDSLGYIWIGTNYGLNRYNGAGYAVYHSRNDSSAPNNDNIVSLMVDSNHKLWISTECGLCVGENGNYRYPQNTGFNVIAKILELNNDYVIASGRQGITKINKKSLEEEARFFRAGMALINTICVTPASEVWISNTHADASLIYILNADLLVEQMLTLPQEAKVQIIGTDKEGDVWIVTDKGVYCYDSESKQPIHLPNSLNELCSKGKIHFLLPYDDESLLIGIAGTGMFRYHKKTQALTTVNRQQKLYGNEYVCFVDSHKNIWLSDRKNPVEFYPENIVYENLKTVSQSLTDKFIKNICLDKDGNLWIRSSKDIMCYNYKQDEVLYHKTGKDTYGGLFVDKDNMLWVINNFRNLEQHEIKNGVPVLKKVIPFQSNIFSISQDKNERIWVSLTDLFAVIDSTGNITYKYAPEGIQFSGLHTAFPSQKMFLYTLSHGVYEFGDDQQFIPLNKSIPNPTHVYIDHNKKYWIGTFNAGLFNFDPRTGEYIQFDTSSGLVDNNVKSITEDHQGNIWFSTSTHITKYDVAKNSFTSLYDNNFNNGKLYSMYCITTAPDGILFFGGSGGVTMVNTKKQQHNLEDIPLHFDAILINGKIQPRVTDNLTLDYTENMITIWYSGINYEAGTSLNYAYKLENFDKEWIEAGNNKRVTYSNLRGGKYNFKVKVKKPDGEWSETALNLKFKVKPAPWASPLAYALYWIIGLSLVYTVIRLIIRWKTQKDRLYLAETQKQLKQEHIDFVTNISHELRTPLSLIYGPLKELIRINGFNEKQSLLINNIQRHTDYLMQLAEQILDYSKSDKNERTLKVVHSDLSGLIRVIADNFRFIAKEKAVGLELRMPDNLPGYFDIEKVEKIVGNLLSNAIKYNQQNGKVDITIHTEEANTVTIEVSDTGIGIDPEKRESIFKRFERLDADRQNPDITGFGIGLNYSQYLAHIHKGKITYQPNHPQGSRFCLTIPINKETYMVNGTADDMEVAVTLTANDTENPGKNKEQSILIIEDNADVRSYLRSLLVAEYNVTTAQNAEEGLSYLQLSTPDLILSDVVMPGKDGFELCKIIKSSAEYGHIPVILLTAKSDMNNNIKGLDCGADAYINKPFDPFYLQAVIENIITNRKRIQQIILNLTPSTIEEKNHAGGKLLSEPEKTFLEKLYNQIDAHLSDEEFNINSMAREMGMSYSNLYAKIKSLTGQTPQTFFNTYRMNIAMEMLKSRKYTVSEVCYKVGASSLANFSRSFKRQFGIPPSAVNED